MLQNEVAEPDAPPPAQPPKSVSQKPLVLNWIAENTAANRDTPIAQDSTPPVAIQSQSTTDLDLPASATELSNKQVG